MKRLEHAIPALALGSLLFLGACGLDEASTAPEVAAQPQPDPTQPVRVKTVGGETGLSRILIDASRDGGVWWFPQGPPFFSGEAPHQGRNLAESLRASGYVVEELPRPFTITSTLLRTYDVVIRATGFGTYSQAELAAYREYVENGGRLLLLGDHMANLPIDGLAASFGITFVGVTRGENRLTTLAEHPITDGVEPLFYMVGAGIVSQPPSAQIIGRLSESSFLDLNKNDFRDSTEVSAPAVLGVMTLGSGRIVFCGDTNLWEQVPQPLLKNVLAWFKSP